jgi:hypothetical protein
MKQVILGAVFITVSLFSYSANKQLPDFTHLQSAEEIVNQIADVMGLQNDFRIKTSDKALNIEATISHRKKYIIYNPQFMNWVTNVTNDKWAAIALFAHEIGHHLKKHTSRWGGSKPRLELEADEFAGYVLRKLGATLEESQLVMRYIATITPTKTHPSRSQRMFAIRQGWDKADNQLITRR